MTHTGESAVSQSRKPASIIAVDLMIGLVAAEALYYAFGMNTDAVLQWAVGILLAGLIAVYGWRKLQPIQLSAGRKGQAKITKLVLLDEDSESIKEWFIQGEVSLLIGKTTGRSEVDIDLADTEYASLISTQHAVLNYTSGRWYIEDLDSRNGIGIRKSNRSSAVKLESDAPSLIETGDMIYIANTRMLVK
ncbi:hypothetical protein PAECIP111893_00014 [Paenibacillus plantiphilus]|uniref:FHA domain-containing protein n=1 Tax=Paenibacillus plantiphilus TaxID=2905650 RepID=A0ABM9BLC9_9BACL|nr:FHA domain-containing protein [Paenibacillus plantiphilus]CAH1189916.1 hypothetical protein PAECIP111893_00014 [Paenibacillus plantiphilus]